MRRPFPYVAVVVVLALAGCSGSDEPGADPVPAASSTPVAPTPTSTPAEPAGPALTESTWESEMYPGIPVQIWPVGKGFVGATTRAVVGLTADGSERWVRRGHGNVYAWLAGDVVVMQEEVPGTDDVYPSPERLVALDTRTGEQLWAADSSYAAADDERVYVATCSGQERNQLGDCELTAHAFRTGAVLWQSPAYDNIEQLTLAGDKIVAQTFPTGDDSVYLPFDRRTGAWTGAAIPARAADVQPGLVIAPDEGDADPSDGCTSTVRGVSMEGAELWTRTLPVRREEGDDGKPTCDAPFYFTPGPSRGIVMSPSAGRELLLDPRTGRTLVTGTPGERIEVADPRMLVVRRADGVASAAIDRRTGRTPWTFEESGSGWRTVPGGRVVQSYQCRPQCKVVLADVRSGRTVVAAVGEFIDVGTTRGVDWMAVDIEGNGYRGRFGYVELP